MGAKLAEMCGLDHAMIRVTIETLESTMVMIFKRAEWTEEAMTLINDGVGKLTLRLCGEQLNGITVTTNAHDKFEFGLEYTDGVLVTGVTA